MLNARFKLPDDSSLVSLSKDSVLLPEMYIPDTTMLLSHVSLMFCCLLCQIIEHLCSASKTPNHFPNNNNNKTIAIAS